MKDNSQLILMRGWSQITYFDIILKWNFKMNDI